MPILSAADLDDFIHLVDTRYAGNLTHPEVVAKYYPIEFSYSTQVDQRLSGFSETYYDQQLALYEEISGRKLNQADGELHPVDVPSLLGARNPLGINNVAFISEHVRALSSMLSIACLGDSPKILDLGAGHGLSSEVFAFCGAQVHAIDIDPALSELAMKRSAQRHFGIKRSILNFDDVGTLGDNEYAAAFFFQSLHHCLRPWKLVEALKKKLVEDGVIGFAGEPLQSHYWKAWGLRLDQESLYVARKFGWFESGWSHDFIRDCFEANGFTLKFFSGGHGGGDIGIASSSQKKLDDVTAKAASLGLTERNAQQYSYFTQIGERSLATGKGGYSTKPGHAGGFLCYGPYIKLAPGRHAVEFRLKRDSAGAAAAAPSFVTFDVTSNQGRAEHVQMKFAWDQPKEDILVCEFTLDEPAPDVEARLLVTGGGQWSCSYPVFRALT